MPEYPHGDPVLTRPGPAPVKPEKVNASETEVKAILEGAEMVNTDLGCGVGIALPQEQMLSHFNKQAALSREYGHIDHAEMYETAARNLVAGKGYIIGAGWRESEEHDGA